MPSRLARIAAAILFLSSLPLLAADEAPWNGAPFAADPKALLAAAEAIPAEEADAVVLLDEARYSFDAQGRATSTRRILYRIVADSAVENWSTIEAPWAPWYQEKPAIEARVVAKDGTVHLLDAKAISEAPAAEESLEMFSDNRIVRAPLPAVATGSVIEQLISYKDKNPMYDAGTSDRFYFGRWVPVHQARLVLEAPSALSLRVANRTGVKELKEEKDGQVRIVYESGPMKAIELAEWNLPFDTSPIPYVAFSTGRSWQEIATRYSGIVDKQIAGSSVKVPAVTSVNKREVIAAILAEIQKNVRYAGVEIGESSIVPRTPSEVLAHKYGDCKDKATLLVAMLRQAGIPASVALLRAGADLDVAADLPGMGQFNHAIVIVDGPSPIWVDPTDEFARAGELPTMDQGRFALVASPKTTALMTTPVMESASNRSIETRIFTLAEEGKAGVVETTEATGAGDSQLRRSYVSADRKKYREQIENYAKQQYAAKSLKKVDAGDAHDLNKPFRLSIEVADAARGTTDGGESAVAIFPAELLDGLPWSLHQYEDKPEDEQSTAAKRMMKKRLHDFVFPEPYVREWHYRLVPPAGYAARTLPQNETVKLGTATLSKEFATTADGAVEAKLRFDSGKRRLTPAEFEEMRKAVHDVTESKALIIGFDQIGQTKLNAGDVAGALAEFRRVAALHPKEARHHADVARALLAGGMGDAARDEIHRAIAIEPAYAGGHQTLGVILEYDLLGRPMRKGFDLPGAIAALRKAKELDPKDIDVRAQLAKILEYGDDGILFGRRNKVVEAIDEYKGIANDLKDTRLDGELMLALAHAGRYAELREFAKTTKNTEQRDLARIIAAAALQGSEAALKEAGSLDATTRKARLSGAAQTLMSLRLYKVAADLMDRAGGRAAHRAEGRGHEDDVRPRAQRHRRARALRVFRGGRGRGAEVAQVRRARSQHRLHAHRRGPQQHAPADAHRRRLCGHDLPAGR